MAVVTIGSSGLDLGGLGLVMGYPPNVPVSLGDLDMRLLARANRTGPVSMDNMHGAVRINQTGTSGTSAGITGWSNGVCGSLTGTVLVKGATMLEVAQFGTSASFVLFNSTDPGRNWIHGVAVRNGNGTVAVGFASEASYVWNATNHTGFWTWNGSWNMTNGVSFSVEIFY